MLELAVKANASIVIWNLADFRKAAGLHVAAMNPPDSLHQMARDISAEDDVSLKQFIASAVAEKVSALRTERYISERAARGSLSRFKAAIARAPDVAPEPRDRL